MVSPVPRWLLFAAVALGLWGVWGFSYKLAGQYMPYRQVMFVALITTVAVDIVVMWYLGAPQDAPVNGIVYALVGGFAGAAGSLAFLFAIEHGKASVVTPLTALYPAVTIALAIMILREPLTVKQGIGIVFALLASLLFAL